MRLHRVDRARVTRTAHASASARVSRAIGDHERAAPSRRATAAGRRASAPPAPSTSTSRPASVTSRFAVRSRDDAGAVGVVGVPAAPSRVSVLAAPGELRAIACRVRERERLLLERHRDVETCAALAGERRDRRRESVERRQQPFVAHVPGAVARRTPRGSAATSSERSGCRRRRSGQSSEWSSLQRACIGGWGAQPGDQDADRTPRRAMTCHAASAASF